VAVIFLETGNYDYCIIGFGNAPFFNTTSFELGAIRMCGSICCPWVGITYLTFEQIAPNKVYHYARQTIGLYDQ
jgi:hypothetical protein